MRRLSILTPLPFIGTNYMLTIYNWDVNHTKHILDKK